MRAMFSSEPRARPAVPAEEASAPASSWCSAASLASVRRSSSAIVRSLIIAKVDHEKLISEKKTASGQGRPARMEQ